MVAFPTFDESIEDLMRFSDTAMYHAKENGRNCYAFYNEAMSMAVENQHNLTSELHNALKRDEFTLHYQPIVNRQGSVIGYEALLRWEHPERGLVPPSDFISDLEVSGMIVPVSEWVLTRSAEQIKMWKQEGFWREGWYVSVNISPRQFYNKEMTSFIKRLALSEGVKPQDFCLEITETVAIENVQFAVSRLAKLREIGLKIALDDFGTGYSSLCYLKELPIDIVKIDRSFVSELGEAGKGSAIVEAVCSISQAYNLMVIAEGIENL